jgi:hypothetical protein
MLRPIWRKKHESNQRSYAQRYPQEEVMKKLLAIMGTAAVILGATDGAAAELPTFEVMGLPITHLQVAIVGGAHVRERSPTPALTLGGMPASPHQVFVLTPRPKIVQEPAPILSKARVHDGSATTNIQ